jgi:hypothetical protein
LIGLARVHLHLKKKRRRKILVILYPYLIEALRMTASRTNLRSSNAFMDISTVETFPLDWFIFLENKAFFHVIE